MSHPQTPPFSSLPLLKSGPHGNAWSLFGASDELGTLNRLTPLTTLSATKEIIHGIRIPTDWPLNALTTPCFDRQPFEQRIKHKEPRTVNDDVLTFNTQGSSQWDGFRHFGYQDEKIYFNGCTQQEIHTTLKNSQHVWVQNGGIVGRGILLDYAHWALSQNIRPDLLSTTEITASQLQAIADSQNVTFQKGDILFIYTGYTGALAALRDEQEMAYVGMLKDMPGIGVESCEETLRWIWEGEFAAVAGDMVAFEAVPFQSKDFWLHEWLLAGWGMPIGELFDLERLAAECRRLKKWSFFYSSVPLNVPGGVASPPNGVAIL